MSVNKTILLTVNYKGRPLEIVRSLVPKGFTLNTMSTTSQKELAEAAAEADYILASGNLKINGEVLQSADKLKMVQRLGVGLDSLDFPALKERNIPVYVNRGVNADSVAEHAVMFILASLRKLTLISAVTKQHIWKKQEQGVMTRELKHCTVGIVGYGNIGRRVASLLKPFGCRILYYDSFRAQGEEDDPGICYASLDELFSCSDVITLHCPLTADTNDLICAGTLSAMKDGVIIVNTSRGRLINEADLLNALNSGKVGFAALDVYQTEPPAEDNAVISHERVICTPHIAGNTYDSFSCMMQYAFESIRLFDEGRTDEIEGNRINF